jgi:hypothetical protein
VVEEASAQDTPVVAGAAGHRPTAWFHRVRSALRLEGEADPGAVRIQVSITQRRGRACRALTSTRRARRLPAGRYTATVRALDRKGLAGQTGEVTFRVR